MTDVSSVEANQIKMYQTLFDLNLNFKTLAHNSICASENPRVVASVREA